MKGTIKSNKTATKGFVFIKGEDGIDYFCHYTALKESGVKLETLADGQEVEFEPSEGTKGPRAENVYPAAA